MRLYIKAGERDATARRTGLVIQLRYVYNTGAYGTHGSAVLFHSTGEPTALYRCPNKKDRRLLRLHQRGPGRSAFRGYGITQVIFAVESAMDDLARQLNIDPFELRDRNVIRPGDSMVSMEDEASDADYGSYGLDQCLEIVRCVLADGNGTMPPTGDDWLEGQGGEALARIDGIANRTSSKAAQPRARRLLSRHWIARDGQADRRAVRRFWGGHQGSSPR